MDFPIYHLDFLNNRMLIAIIAIGHVLINHSMAVGGIPLVAYLESKGIKENNPAWDHFAYKLLFFFFVITTSAGALTGVGIWFSASLINPAAIGSLLRVFFWTWFIEWIVFVTEVVLIMYYFLTWKKYNTPELKRKHLKIGVVLSIASWVTMVLIVAILSFMMDPGNWNTNHTFFSAMGSPIYPAQLAFRTPFSMVLSGGIALVLTLFFAKEKEFRAKLIRTISGWILAWTIPCALGAFWYSRMIPANMQANLSVAVGTQAFMSWYSSIQLGLWVVCGVIAVVALGGLLAPKRLPAPLFIVPFVAMAGLVGMFERVREFVRKPYAIPGYLYSNGYTVADYPLLQTQGILKTHGYAKIKEITSQNKVEAGKEIFLLACTRCHTINGVNSVKGNLQAMYGSNPWDPVIISKYIAGMHTTRGYMPPFPGNDKEREALGLFLAKLQTENETLNGAQTTGLNAGF